MAYKMDRKAYAGMFGPTVGDKIRLGDTELFIEIEKDYTTYGEELKFGAGKTIRDGLAQHVAMTHEQGVLDLAIINATILDHSGIIKADIGIRNGHIVGIGKAGNPDIQDGVDSNMVIGVGTEIMDATGDIVTAGAIDTHIHYTNPRQVELALASGTTTLSGGGSGGPAEGSLATSTTPGPFYIETMLKAVDDLPMNFIILGRGNSSTRDNLVEQVRAGAAGFKIHEDWGSTPAVIDSALKIGEEFDLQIAIHTDSINEAGDVNSTLAAIDGRTMHTFHIEGAGGGHAPDNMILAGEYNIIPGSTNPTIPYTINTVAEHLDMLMGTHHLSKNIPDDVAFAESRIRPGTISGEDIFHDRGLISIMSSDSQAMGRIGELVTRTWQMADYMKAQTGRYTNDETNGNDNERAKRYVAKYTINPAKVCGIDEYVGSVEVGKFADLVLWRRRFFGVHPKVVLKGGMAVVAKMGDANASIPTPQPILYQPMFGALGKAVHGTSITFVSKEAEKLGIKERLGLDKVVKPVIGASKVTKKDMVHNDVVAKDISVDPETYTVYLNGEKLELKPATKLPLNILYNLF